MNTEWIAKHAKEGRTKTNLRKFPAKCKSLQVHMNVIANDNTTASDITGTWREMRKVMGVCNCRERRNENCCSRWDAIAVCNSTEIQCVSTPKAIFQNSTYLNAINVARVVCMCVFCWPVPNMRPNWVDTSIFGGISRSIWNLAAPMYPSPISVVLHQSDLGRGDLAAICSYEMANADRNATSSKNRKMNITIKAVANNDAERAREKWRRISKNIRSQKTPTGIW